MTRHPDPETLSTERAFQIYLALLNSNHIQFTAGATEISVFAILADLSFLAADVFIGYDNKNLSEEPDAFIDQQNKEAFGDDRP